MPADPQQTTPTDDQEYEDLLISVVTRVMMILSTPDDDEPDPESMFRSATR